MTKCKELIDGVRCPKQPCYGLEAGKPRFCSAHGKQRGMRNVMARRCAEPGDEPCPIHATFGNPGGQPVYCTKHGRLRGLIDLVHNDTCSEPECSTRPTWGTEKGKGLYCASHGKLRDGMRCITTTKFCTEPGDEPCLRRAIFGEVGGRPLYCGTHGRLRGMVDINYNKTCSEPGCTTRPTWGLVAEKPMFCSFHGKARDNMWCVTVSKFCVACKISKKSEKYDGHCAFCFSHLFPDHPVVRHIRIKEQHVADFVKEIMSGRDQVLTFDSKVAGGCSRRRPDVHIECLTHSIIVECDENQHSSEEYCSCESKRTMQIFMDLGNRPMVLLRLNADAFVNAAGNKVRSPFGVHKSFGTTLVLDKDEWASRLAVLKQRVEFYLEHMPEQEITTEHLYYDGFV